MFLSLVAIIFSIFIGYNIYSVENSQQTFDVSFWILKHWRVAKSSGNCPEYGSGCLDGVWWPSKREKMVTYYFSWKSIFKKKFFYTAFGYIFEASIFTYRCYSFGFLLKKEWYFCFFWFINENFYMVAFCKDYDYKEC